jgi:hypothetical protein
MGHSLQAHATSCAQPKSAILLWMDGGPSTIDLWDLKPGASTSGPFNPIATAGDMQICEHLPQIAKVMDRMSIVRSMSTREADHHRGRYYMRTGYVPNPSVDYPSYGAVVPTVFGQAREIPPFVDRASGGFLGMAWAPFSVDSNGQVRDLQMGLSDDRVAQRMQALQLLENGFIQEKRGPIAEEHAKVLQKTLNLMTSKQMEAFNVSREEQRQDVTGKSIRPRILMARRLVEIGVPFISRSRRLGQPSNIFNARPTLPMMDKP